MKRCKHCKESNFGAELIEVSKVAVCYKDGVEVYRDESQFAIVERKYVERVCLTCQKEVTEDDLYDLEVCPVCGKEVDTLINGICDDCNSTAIAIFEANKKEILLSLLKSLNNESNDSTTTTDDTEEKKEKVKQKSKKSKASNANAKAKQSPPAKVEPEPVKVNPEPEVAASGDDDDDLFSIEEALDDIDTDGLDIYSDDVELF